MDLAPRALRCLLPLALLLLCSCTEVVRSGDKSLWTFAPWVGVLVVLGSLSGIDGSFAWMAYRDRWTGLAGILLFVIAGVIAGPGV